MKRAILTFALAVMTIAVASAENITIGEKLPEMRLRQWLMDMQPEEAEYTCILFYHSESPLCRRCLERVKALIRKYDTKLNVVIVTKEDYDAAGVTLTEHLDDGVTVAFDDNGRTFRDFDVKFIPFCVMSDRKHRAVWCGNGLTLDKRVIDNIIKAE